MDVDGTSKPKEEKLLLVMLVGAPGSGKSTFCEEVMRSSTRPWIRVCQDIIKNGKAGNKAQCLSSAAGALKEGKNAFIDRCNLDREQRSGFAELGGPQVDVHAVVLDLPAKLCISRSVKRSGHEGNLQGGKAAAVVNRMLQKKELPTLSEGFNRITFCQTESDVKVALNTYSALGPLDNLPHGCFGQKRKDPKVQLDIMKFFKKAEVPVVAESRENCGGNSTSQSNVMIDPCRKDMEKFSSNSDKANIEPMNVENISVGSTVSHVDHAFLRDAPTLAFPSISTSDFQFDHEKAAEIIVEKVAEFSNKLANARFVLVDLTHGSKILSLVKTKAAKKNLDPRKFFTHVGDITCLKSTGGLHCAVIANAANWRLKPGGGGVNAAIFKAAGPVLESATKERAQLLLPGNAVAVPLPSSSPLFAREGVTHVIHVLGPNMNPQRPDCLNNDYNKGCKILREAYTSLFEAFASIVRTATEQKSKRDADDGSEKSKKYKGSQDDVEVNCSGTKVVNIDSSNKKSDGSLNKTWGSSAQALHQIAMHPEKHKDELLEISEDVVVLNDLYPKAQKHVLVLARTRGLDCLADVQNNHLHLLKRMHAVGLKWAEKFLHENASLVFRLGYHSVPSMRQLHLHVISQDFDSKHLKNKKHWNSFNTDFFRDSLYVIDEVSNNGKVTLRDDDKLLSMELRCHRCRSAHPNIPRLKYHISSCQSPFPACLLQNGRLVRAQGAIPPCLMPNEWDPCHTMRENNLTGKIPDKFPACCALRTLDVNGNQLDGSITKSPANCMTLEVHHLGNNGIIDGFPCSLKKISILRVMVLRQNKFHGSIGCPNTGDIWQMLHIADLAFNNFTGQIPSCIGNLRRIESLDLSNNSLTGEIPAAQMAYLNFLSSLNLSYNHLVGRIPSGTQIQSFEAYSFIGNDGLCGSPLTPNCSSKGKPRKSRSSYSESSINWNFITAEVGFVFGIGIVLCLWLSGTMENMILETR